MTFGSLCSGIGGLDLGCERAGMQCKWQVEIDANCRHILERHFKVPFRWDDMRAFPPDECLYGIKFDFKVDCIVGGDPCPKHSRARSNGESLHPDLSGYFLAVVGGLQPRWVVRENVPAPTVDDFAAGLECIGYGTVIVRLDAAEATGQSRQRDFIVGCHQKTGLELAGELFPDCEHGSGPYTTRLGTRPITPALTTHRTRYDSRDCYVWEHPTGLRILESQEREALAGFPDGWTDGFSPAMRAKMLGNSAVPEVMQWIGKRIIAAESVKQ